MFERLLPSALCRRFMTPLGLELEEALSEGEWLLTEHTLEHKASKTYLWICNGYTYFRLYKAANITDEEQLRRMLNRFDHSAACGRTLEVPCTREAQLQSHSPHICFATHARIVPVRPCVRTLRAHVSAVSCWRHVLH